VPSGGGPRNHASTPSIRAQRALHALVAANAESLHNRGKPMIRKLKTGQYRLYSRKLDPRTGKRRNLGTFATREEAVKHERAVQYFKHH
jgi:hypothetical protein